MIKSENKWHSIHTIITEVRENLNFLTDNGVKPENIKIIVIEGFVTIFYYL